MLLRKRLHISLKKIDNCVPLKSGSLYKQLNINFNTKLNTRSKQMETTNQNIIYKILLKPEWEKFQQTKEFIGTELDIKDGYIHMSSTKEQMERVKNKYYKDVKVYLLKIDSDKLSQSNKFKYEPISNGDLYPHYYDKLLISHVISAETM